MSDLEAAFLKHLGNSFVPYVGREEGLPKPDELIAMEKTQRQREAERRRQEKERKRQEHIAKERAAQEHLRKTTTELERVLRAVCAVHGTTLNDLIKQDRRHSTVAARLHAMWLMRHRLNMGWSAIGRVMARDHGTVISNCERFHKSLRTIPQVAEVEDLLTSPSASPDSYSAK
jgi:chromosomal replication initiation ATPase DnaA